MKPHWLASAGVQAYSFTFGPFRPARHVIVTSRGPLDAPTTVRPLPEMRSGGFGDPRLRGLARFVLGRLRFD